MGGMTSIAPIKATSNGFSITETIKCIIVFQNPIYESYVVYAAPETPYLVWSATFVDAWTWPPRLFLLGTGPVR